MLTLTDLILAAALFAGVVCVIAMTCVAQAWRWDRRYRDRRRDDGQDL